MLFIFGLLQLLLVIFPGWLEPFSNTFGYAIAKIGGAEKVVREVLKTDQPQGDISKAISNIYNDPSIFLNQFNYENEEDFKTKWAKSGNLFNTDAGVGGSKYNDFRNMVKLKDLVAQFVWYMLAGILVTSRSYNYIINQPCGLSPEVAEKIASKYAKSDTSGADKNTTPKGFVYDAAN
jgi:hypothetical protein